jgi:hypothetical protein
MLEMLERYNKALGDGGNAGDIISNPSVELIVEIEERSDDADSIINRVSVSGEEDSIDSKEFVVVMARRRKRMINLQFMWIIMVIISIALFFAQAAMSLNGKK